MRYFDHDANASLDTGISALRVECGGAAVDAYWAILEMMYEEEGPVELLPEEPSGTEGVSERFPIKTKVVSARLLTTPQELVKWVSAMVEIGLFYIVSGSESMVFSHRAETNIEAYRSKRETARQNGRLGGRRKSSGDPKKPKANQGGTKGVSKGLAKEKEKVLGLDKLNPVLPGGSGGAFRSAPPPQATCPRCGSRLFKNPQTGNWDCGSCLSSFREGS